MRREVKPEPVPPPKEWKIRKPWSPEHCSDCFLPSQIWIIRNRKERKRQGKKSRKEKEAETDWIETETTNKNNCGTKRKSRRLQLRL
jgi:hypothetical protein